MIRTLIKRTISCEYIKKCETHRKKTIFLTDGLQTRFGRENEGSLVGERKKDVKAKNRLLKKRIVYFKREIVSLAYPIDLWDDKTLSLYHIAI